MLLWQRIVGLSETTVGRKYVRKVFVKTLKDSGLYLHLQSALQSRAPPHCMTHCMLALSALLVCILPPRLLPCHCGNLWNDGGHIVWRFDQSASFRIFDSTFYFPHYAFRNSAFYPLPLFWCWQIKFVFIGAELSHFAWKGMKSHGKWS